MANPKIPSEIKLLPSIPKLDVRTLNKITNIIPISNYTNRANLVNSSKNVVDFLLKNTKNTDSAYTFLKYMRNYYENAFVYDMISKNARNVANGYDAVLSDHSQNVSNVSEFTTWYNSKSLKEISEFFTVYNADNYSIDRNFIKYLDYHNLLTAQFISENDITNTVDGVDSVEFTFNEKTDTVLDNKNTYKTSFNVSEDYFEDIENAYKINKKVLTDIKTFISEISVIGAWTNAVPKKNVYINILSMFNDVNILPPTGKDITTKENKITFEVIFTYEVYDAVSEKEKLDSNDRYDTTIFAVNNTIIDEINNLLVITKEGRK